MYRKLLVSFIKTFTCHCETQSYFIGLKQSHYNSRLFPRKMLLREGQEKTTCNDYPFTSVKVRNKLLILFFILFSSISLFSCESNNSNKYKQEQDKLEQQLDEQRRTKIEEKERLEREIDSLKIEKEKKAKELKKLSEEN
ncbi:MAG: hypothetical protein HND52_19375 [Ignavibacteriae bacterium]|nr:hypothetical protein [Ignavibacteriota bacterium]